MAHTPGTMSYADRKRFAASFLEIIGADKDDVGNMLTMLAWMSRENTAAKNNPLATTASWIKNPDGSDPTLFNKLNEAGTMGVRNYESFEQGVQASAETLLAEKYRDEYGPLLELLRKGTTPEEVLATPGAVGSIRTWGSFHMKTDGEGNPIRDENGEILYTDNWGSRNSWGASKKDLEKEIQRGEIEIVETPRKGADVEQWPDIQNPEETEDWTEAPEIIGGDFRDELTEHDPDRARALAEGIASGDLVGQEAQVDAPEGGIPESWMDKELVDSSVPTPRQDRRGTGITGADGVFLEEIFANIHSQLSVHLAEKLGLDTSDPAVTGVSAGKSPGTHTDFHDRIQTKFFELYSDGNQDRLENAEDIAEQTLQIFSTKAAQHRGGRAKLTVEDRELLFALIGEGNSGRQGSSIGGVNIATPELNALYRNEDATYAEVLAELQKAPAHARKLAENALDITEIKSLWELWSEFGWQKEGPPLDHFDYMKTVHDEPYIVDYLRDEYSQEILDQIEQASAILETDEFKNQLNNLAEPGTFDRQAEWTSPEFIHAIVVDRHLSPPEVGAMGPPNAPSYVGSETLSDGTKSGVQSVTGPTLSYSEPAQGMTTHRGGFEAADAAMAGVQLEPTVPADQIKKISDEALTYIADEFGGSMAFYEGLEKAGLLDLDLDGDGVAETTLLEYLKGGESNPDVIWGLFAQTPWFAQYDAHARDFQEKWHQIGGTDNWVPLLDPDSFEWNMTPDMMAELDPQYDILVREAERLGMNTDNKLVKESLMSMAYNAKMMNLDAYEIKKEFISNVDLAFDQTAIKGSSTFRAIKNKIQQNAGQYMLQMDETSLNTFAEQIYLGETTYDALTSNFYDQAKKMNPALASIIDQGYTPAAYFASYSNIAGNLLERHVDFLSSRDSKMFGDLTGAYLDGDNQQQIMSRTQFEKYIRNTPEWDQTDNARDEAYGTVSNLLSSFGFPGY